VAICLERIAFFHGVEADASALAVSVQAHRPSFSTSATFGQQQLPADRIGQHRGSPHPSYPRPSSADRGSQDGYGYEAKMEILPWLHSSTSRVRLSLMSN